MSTFALRYLRRGRVILPLDSLDKVYGVYALKRLVSRYPATSPLVRLRRSSDNVELDFAPGSDGFVSTSAVTTWLAGATGFVKTLYDQTGNGRDATQATTARQPTIFLTGRPKVQFASASSQWMSITNVGGFARNIGAVSLIAVRKYSTYAADVNLIALSNNATSGRCVMFYGNTAAKFQAGGRRLDADSFGSTAGFAKNLAWDVEIGRFDYTNSDLYHDSKFGAEVNNSFQTGGSTSDTDGANNVIGAVPAGTAQYFNGLFATLVLVQKLLTDAEVTSLEASLIYNGWAEPYAYPWKGSIITRSATPASSFIGSPSIVRESSTGDLFALHDFFISTDSGSTGGALYKSTDNGVTWAQVATFATLEWCTIWEHTDGYLYIFGVTTAFGQVQIGKSTDHGVNWTFATLSTSGGPLAAAGAGTTAPNYVRGGGLPPCYLGGYMFFGLENFAVFSSSDYSTYKTLVLSVPDNVDLMDKANWTASSQLQIGAHSYGATAGMIETNVVSDLAGNLYSVVRLFNSTTTDKAVFIPLGRSGGTITMPMWNAAWIRTLPGGHIKFQLVRSGSYFYSITNENTAVARAVGSANDKDQRNRVVLVRGAAADLSTATFTTIKTIINEDDVAALAEVSLLTSVGNHSFQYYSFLIENGYALPLCRAAWDGAASYGFTNILAYGAPVSLT